MSPNKDETAVHCCDPALSVLVMSGVSKRLSRSVSFTISCLYTKIQRFARFKNNYFGRIQKDFNLSKI